MKSLKKTAITAFLRNPNNIVHTYNGLMGTTSAALVTTAFLFPPLAPLALLGGLTLMATADGVSKYKKGSKHKRNLNEYIEIEHNGETYILNGYQLAAFDDYSQKIDNLIKQKNNGHTQNTKKLSRQIANLGEKRLWILEGRDKQTLTYKP